MIKVNFQRKSHYNFWVMSFNNFICLTRRFLWSQLNKFKVINSMFGEPLHMSSVVYKWLFSPPNSCICQQQLLLCGLKAAAWHYLSQRVAGIEREIIFYVVILPHLTTYLTNGIRKTLTIVMSRCKPLTQLKGNLFVSSFRY